MAEASNSSRSQYPLPPVPHLPVVSSTTSLINVNELYTTTSNDSATWRDVFRSKAPEYAKALPTDEDAVRTGTKFDQVEAKGPWRTSTLLSLDGGGIRGLSSLMLLQALMQMIERIETKERSPPARTSADSPTIEADRIDEELRKIDPKAKESSSFLPCHYFDYIAGTSTGGLIAVMLGRLRMSIDLALDEYRDITLQVFTARRRTKMSVIRDLVVPSRKRERKLDQTIKHLEPGTTAHENTFKSDEIRCKTIVCSLQRSSNRGSMVPYLFRSYDLEDQPEGEHVIDSSATETYPISQIMLATSCSPYYFKPMKLGNHQYCDAGFSLTNPTYEVFHELNLKHHSPSTAKLHRPVSLVVSVGCGYDPGDANRTIRGDYDSFNDIILRLNRALSSVSEDVHSLMTAYTEKRDNFSYFRFNAKSKLSMAGGNHHYSPKQEFFFLRERIEVTMKKYLCTPLVVADLERCAAKLVDMRRLRCATNRWETFAFGSRYRCTHENPCDRQQRGAPLFLSRDELVNHLRNVHNMPPADAVHGPKIKTLVDRGRTNSD